VTFRDNAHLMHVIDKIVSTVGRRCDEVSPMVDARLKDGSRVNAVITPLAIDGPSMSIRRFGADPITWDDYLKYNSVTRQMVDFLRACVIAHLNILVAGGTGSGKTTLLNNLSSFIPDTERIVTIEDAAELRLRQPHVVRLESRPANIEGKGKIAIRDLLINALRMRPDRIVVGEVRGEEALDMLQAMNTGHDGSLTTVHANTPRDALARIETMIAMGATNLPERAMRQQMASAIQLVVQRAAERVTYVVVFAFMAQVCRTQPHREERSGAEPRVELVEAVAVQRVCGDEAGVPGRPPEPDFWSGQCLEVSAGRREGSSRTRSQGRVGFPFMRVDVDFEPLVTERLRLRRSRPEDAETISAYRSDPEVGRYQGWERTDPDSIRAEIEKMSLRAPGEPGGWMQLSVEERDGGRPVGDVGLSLADDEPGVVKIGSNRSWTSSRQNM
jgi:Flp pilus assembly CpaF family ATPase